MNYRSLLVLLDGDAQCDARTGVAVRFAADHQCHLLGVAPTGLIQLSTGLGAAAHGLDEATAARAEMVRRGADHIDRFLAHCAAAGVASFDGEEVEGDKVAALLHRALCADLTVISQAHPASASHRDEQRFVEQVLLHNARPTLLVPQAPQAETVGRRVLVAWDDSPGAARAAADAMPLLRHAGQVHLRIWRRDGEPPEAALRPRLDSVQRWFERQGVAAEARIETAAGAIGDAILGSAAALGADLIVMGTYGHSRWTQRLFGGATRTALARSPVALLMSH